MIPKIIHCCWFGGKPLPNDVKNYINSWKKYNPDFEIKIWNEQNFDVRSVRYTREAYECRKWAFITDYVRLKVLYDYGGIYMDTDVEAIKPFGDMLLNKAFSGFEDDENIPTGTMGAEKGNPWIAALLKYYDDKSFYLPNGEPDLTTNVITITNITVDKYPLVLNNTFQNLGDVTFYPSDVLCAKSKIDGKVRKTSHTVTVHHFRGSWTTPKTRFIKFLKKRIGYNNVKTLVNLKRILQGKNKI
jgi:mannosyltransferase OCH1-like enzyme